MAYDPNIHHRRSILLRTHDYADGGKYYVTVCAEERRRLFGVVVNGRMALNDAGRAVRDEWLRSAAIRREIVLDEWVVMPDHFHAVVMIRDPGTNGSCRGDRRVALPNGPAPKSLGALIAGFKSASGRRVNELRRTPGAAVWQRNYYEHIVRDAADLARIRAYIRDNPANWDVLRFGEPRFRVGHAALWDLPKTAFLASRRTGGPMCPPSPAFPSRPACVMSGFLSPLERAVFEECLEAGTPMVRVLACGLPKAFPLRARRAIDAGRLLVVTPFGPEVARINAERAAWCNQYLLQAAERIVVGHLNPDGMLACLLADLPSDKPVTVL